MLNLKELYEQLPNNAPVVLSDQDGVLADFDSKLQAEIAVCYPNIAPIDPAPVPPPFYTNDLYPKEHNALIWGISNKEGFIENLPLMQPIEEIAEGWGRLMRAGFRMQVCTSPLITPFCAAEKRTWLTRTMAPSFGAWVTETAIIERDKTLVDGTVLIDDKPTLDDSSAPWTHVVYDRPCNRHVTDKLRAYSWTDTNLVKTVAQAAGVEVPRHLL